MNQVERILPARNRTSRLHHLVNAALREFWASATAGRDITPLLTVEGVRTVSGFDAYRVAALVGKYMRALVDAATGTSLSPLPRRVVVHLTGCGGRWDRPACVQGARTTCRNRANLESGVSSIQFRVLKSDIRGTMAEKRRKRMQGSTTTTTRVEVTFPPFQPLPQRIHQQIP